MKLKLEKKRKGIRRNNNELEVEKYPKNKQTIQLPCKPPNCPSCKRNNWLDFVEGYYCKT